MYSPLELQQIEFEKKVFGGYDMEDVDKTFGVLKHDYEELYIENADMKKKIRELEASLAESIEMKESLHNVLVAAQKSSEELKNNAEKEAELIVKNAQADAREIISAAEKEKEDMERRKEALKSEVDVFITKMSALFEAQIKYLNKTEE